MQKLFAPNYNLGSTLLGGQSFNFYYDREKDFYYGALRGRILKLKKEGDYILWETFPKKDDDEEFVKRFLRLDIDYEDILKIIAKDEHVLRAIQNYKGIRILRQDFLEAFLGFISSQNRSIKVIRQSMKTFREKFGSRYEIDGKIIYSFPDLRDLEGLKIEDLSDCKFGYRDKFIKGAIDYLLSTNLHKTIHTLSMEEARTELLKVNGIGEKVADCILMFGLCHDNVFPLDVWAKKIVHDLYGLSKDSSYEEKRIWTMNYFGGFASWAAQFLFEDIRGFREEDYFD